ncbi:MAG: phosphate acyltransferase, partial [Paludibacter sp.]|nr:phosphate acyltransferase [Paludibacter sp.]
MLAIRSFSELTSHLKQVSKSKKFVVVNPADANSLEAITRAVSMGFASAQIIGNPRDYDIQSLEKKQGLQFIDCGDPVAASTLAVEMVKSGEADILMKGLVNTDILLRAVMKKEIGLVPYGNVVTFIAAIEIPGYPKFLFITDPAVIPEPNVRQRTTIIHYAIETAKNFGIRKPKVALMHGTEKMNLKLSFMEDYRKILELGQTGEFGDAIIAGPLDLFLAINPELGKIKQVDTPISGDADILIFPSFVSANIFYKSMVTFAHAEIGGMLFGTEKPVVLT